MNIVLEAIDRGTTLHRGIADHVAAGMKMWAMEMGATHYTHWFQPLTEGTAEKHDSFIDYINGPDGGIIERFSGKLLAQQNQMRRVSPAAVSAIFEQGDIPHGILLRPLLLLTTLVYSDRFYLYTGERWTQDTAIKIAFGGDKAAVSLNCSTRM